MYDLSVDKQKISKVKHFFFLIRTTPKGIKKICPFSTTRLLYYEIQGLQKTALAPAAGLRLEKKRWWVYYYYGILLAILTMPATACK